jgi:hypothetical protein
LSAILYAALARCTLAPEPVPTRCRTWIEAVNFYIGHFETVKSILARFPSESAVWVLESQSAFSNPKVACSVAYIWSNFGWLLESIKRLELQGFPLQESMDIMKNANEKLNVVKGRLVKVCPPSCRWC